MSLIARKVTNLMQSDLTLRLPGSNKSTNLVLHPHVNVDLLDEMSAEELALMDSELRLLASHGSLLITEELDSVNLFQAVDPADIVKALKKLQCSKAVIRGQIESPDATDLDSALELINEIKELINMMNTRSV